MACESQPMIGGNGEYSYSHNSTIQREGAEYFKALIEEAIQEKLDLNQINASSPSSAFCIADLGCSVGPNTFITVQNIIQSVMLNYKSIQKNHKELEFQVLFNDIPSNDFNTLFQSLPPKRNYFAAGIPGRFQGRLFPKESIHFVHSSFSLHWLSRSPRELEVINKGSLYYHDAPKEVVEAYSNQFARDMMSFLAARAEEVVSGGLVAILFLCQPNDLVPSECNSFLHYDFMKASLLDMVKTGSITTEQVESFNVPLYYATPREVASLVEKNGCFSIEAMEAVDHPFLVDIDEATIRKVVLLWRALFEGLVQEHFGAEMVDEFFERYSKKFKEYVLDQPIGLDKNLIDLFVVLKRKYV